jgi:hypothetical protein
MSHDCVHSTASVRSNPVRDEDFRWHDLHHIWASWHVRNRTPLFALQENGRLVERGDGAALRAPRCGSPGAS